MGTSPGSGPATAPASGRLSLDGLVHAARLMLVLHLVLKLAFLAALALLVWQRWLDQPDGRTGLDRWLFALDRLGWVFAAVGVALVMALVHRAARILDRLGRPGLRSPRAMALSVAVPPLQLHAGQAVFEDLWERSQGRPGSPAPDSPAGSQTSTSQLNALPPATSASRFWQHWVMGGFAAWLGTVTQGVMMVPEPVALGILVIGLLMQLWADGWGLAALGQLRARLEALPPQ